MRLQPPVTAKVVRSSAKCALEMERTMRLVPYATALALLAATSACSDWFNHSNAAAPSNQAIGTTPFSNGLRTNQQQPTNCSPADSTCGSGIGNPSVQSPTQKREQNVSPQ
jgi:hypothetical protein